VTRLRTIVVDDEEPARAHLTALLAEDPEIVVAAACDGGAAAIDAITRDRPPADLVFLDVQMPEIDGFDVIEAVGADRMPPVVFVTAFEEHAVRAFEVQALDYLLKPFDRARFERTLARAKAELAGGQAAIAQVVRARPLERLLPRDGDRIVVVPVAEVDWIQAAGNYVELHVGNRSYLLRSTLTALEERLSPEKFLRIHRDTIVQLDRIGHIETGGPCRVVLRDGTARAVGRNYLARLIERL
jgi:two-component system, LytTR family, response regulator